MNRLRNCQRTKLKGINFNWVFQVAVLKSVLSTQDWGIVLLGLLDRAGLPVCLSACLPVCLSVRPRLAWVCALGRWAPGCVCARAGRLSGEKERRRLGRAGGRPGVGRGLCGEQPNGASWFCLRSRFHFCLITRPWPTSQDRFFSTTFYLEEPFCIFIKNCPGSNFGMSRCCR